MYCWTLKPKFSASKADLDTSIYHRQPASEDARCSALGAFKAFSGVVDLASEASPNISEHKAFTEDDPRCTSGVHCTLLYTIPATSLYWPQMPNAVVYPPILSYYHCGKIMQTFTSARQKLILTIRSISILRVFKMLQTIWKCYKLFTFIHLCQKYFATRFIRLSTIVTIVLSLTVSFRAGKSNFLEKQKKVEKAIWLCNLPFGKK